MLTSLGKVLAGRLCDCKSFHLYYVHVTPLECIMCNDLLPKLLILHYRGREGVSPQAVTTFMVWKP
jgi:hypothetical protein